MSTVVGISFIQRAPEDAMFFVPDLGCMVTKKFAVFHALMGRIVAARSHR